MRNRNTLCVLRYKAGAFPDTQRLLKVYKQKGIKFIDGNSWLSKYNSTYPTHSSAIFPEYNSSSIKFASDNTTYSASGYESDILSEYTLCGGTCGIQTYDCMGPSNFSSSEIKDAWINGVIIVQSQTLDFAMHLFPRTPIYFLPVPAPAFDYETYEFQDIFGNIVAIEFDWDLDPGEYGVDWKVKSAIVLYP